jgi:hypothetical protein
MSIGNQPLPRPVFGTLVAKEAAIRKKGRGTYERVGRASTTAVRWRHTMYGGSVQLKRGPTEAITARFAPSRPRPSAGCCRHSWGSSTSTAMTRSRRLRYNVGRAKSAGGCTA